jgi:hypothetical protein
MGTPHASSLADSQGTINLFCRNDSESKMSSLPASFSSCLAKGQLHAYQDRNLSLTKPLTGRRGLDLAEERESTPHCVQAKNTCERLRPGEATE